MGRYSNKGRSSSRSIQVSTTTKTGSVKTSLNLEDVRMKRLEREAQEKKRAQGMSQYLLLVT